VLNANVDKPAESPAFRPRAISAQLLLLPYVFNLLSNSISDYPYNAKLSRHRFHVKIEHPLALLQEIEHNYC